MASSTIVFFLIEYAPGRQPEASSFLQGYKEWNDFANRGFTLANCLEFAGGNPKRIQDYSFWIHSNSMAAAVQLLDNRSILVMHDLYYKHDQVITIHIRPIDDPSPNSTRAGSHVGSLTRRRGISGGHKVSDVVPRQRIVSASKSLSVTLLEPVQMLPEEDKVVLDLGGGKSEIFSKNYLLGWIKAKVEEGKEISEIEVESLTPNRCPVRVLLTDKIWMTSLLRGPWEAEFLKLWDERKQIAHQRSSILDQLNSNPDFANNARQFIKDLRHFGQNVEVQNRLHHTQHEFFLGQPYFDSRTVEKLLSLPVGRGDLDYELKALILRKMERNEGDELCASHDLAPLYEAALGLSWEKIKGEVLGALTNLKLGEQSKKSGTSSKAKTLGKKASAFFKGKKRDENLP